MLSFILPVPMAGKIDFGNVMRIPESGMGDLRAIDVVVPGVVPRSPENPAGTDNVLFYLAIGVVGIIGLKWLIE